MRARAIAEVAESVAVRAAWAESSGARAVGDATVEAGQVEAHVVSKVPATTAARMAAPDWESAAAVKERWPLSCCRRERTAVPQPQGRRLHRGQSRAIRQ